MYSHSYLKSSASLGEPPEFREVAPLIYNIVTLLLYRIVCERVATERYDGVRASVGMPTEKEAREVLVEVKGKIKDAVYKIFCQRKEKVPLPYLEGGAEGRGGREGKGGK